MGVKCKQVRLLSRMDDKSIFKLRNRLSPVTWASVRLTRASCPQACRVLKKSNSARHRYLTWKVYIVFIMAVKLFF